MSEKKYKELKEAGLLDENAIYLTPDTGSSDEETIFFCGDAFSPESNNSSSGENTEVLEGSGQEYYTMAPSVLSFRSTAPLDELQDVTVNGEVLDPSNYDLEEGSTIVKLKTDYLKTLDAGSYNIKIESQNQTADGEFTVAAPQLNAYGFLVKQPYSVMLDGDPQTFIFRDNETLLIFANILGGQSLSESTFTRNGNVFNLELACGNVTGQFSSDGKSFICEPFEDWNGNIFNDIVFTTCNDIGTADTDYVYQYRNENNGWVIRTVLDTSKEYLPVPKSNINGKPVTAIRQGAFDECTNLKSFTLPENIIYLYTGIFDYCTNLEHLYVSETLKSTDLGYGHLPSSCYNIYNDCAYLGSETNPYAVLIQPLDTFNKDTLETHENTKVLGQFGIQQLNSSIKKVILNEGLITTSNLALDVGNRLTDIEVPDSLVCVGETYGILNDTIMSKLTQYDNALYLGNARNPFVLLVKAVSKDITSCKVHDDTKVIGPDAFFGCSKVINLELPTGLKGISCDFLFGATSLTSIHLPETLENISYGALNSSLQQVVFDGTINQWDKADWGNSSVELEADYVQCSDGNFIIERVEDTDGPPILGGL